MNEIAELYMQIGAAGVMAVLFAFMIMNLIKSQREQTEDLEKIKQDLTKLSTESSIISSKANCCTILGSDNKSLFRESDKFLYLGLCINVLWALLFTATGFSKLFKVYKCCFNKLGALSFKLYDCVWAASYICSIVFSLYSAVAIISSEVKFSKPGIKLLTCSNEFEGMSLNIG